MKRHKFPYGLGICIVGTVLFIIGLMLSCGKLSDDTNRPTFPIGTSAGMPIPIGLRSSLGTYTLTAWANPNTIPADLATFSIVHAQLTDTSGRSVENFEVEFEAELGYLSNDPEGPSTLSTTATGITGAGGTVSLYYYGSRAGSDQVQARVDLDRDGTQDLYVTTLIKVTGGPGVPGPGRPGVDLVVDPIVVDYNYDCAAVQNGTETLNLTATVWDESGDLVGEGVRVELSGDIPVDFQRWQETDSTGQATWDPYTLDWRSQITGSATQKLTWTFLATVIINGRRYTDPATFSVIIYCTSPEPTPTAAPTATPVPSVALAFVGPTSLPTTGGTVMFRVTVDQNAAQNVTVNWTALNISDVIKQPNPNNGNSDTNAVGIALVSIGGTTFTVGDIIQITADIDHLGVKKSVIANVTIE